MQLLIDRILDGVNNGAIYAFLALAMVCVYRGTGHLNLAQGEMAMFSAFLAYAFVQLGVPVVPAILIVIVIASVAAGAIERFLIKPHGRGPEAGHAILLVTIGLFLLLNASAGIVWGNDPLPFPAVVPDLPGDYVSVLGGRLYYQQLVILGLLGGVLAGLYCLFRFTTLGLAMRATSSNPDAAKLLGIPVNRINTLGWVLAAGVGALVGPLIAPSTTLTTGMMFNFLIYAVAAATLGGFDSPGGAVLAGFIIGIAENLIASYVEFVGQDLKQATALVILIAVLMVRPAGLFGTTRVERV